MAIQIHGILKQRMSMEISYMVPFLMISRLINQVVVVIIGVGIIM